MAMYLQMAVRHPNTEQHNFEDGCGHIRNFFGVFPPPFCLVLSPRLLYTLRQWMSLPSAGCQLSHTVGEGTTG